MDKILIALDNHETNNKIAQVGLALAARLHAKTMLLHVYPVSVAMDSNMAYDDYGIPDFTTDMDWDGIFSEESMKFLKKTQAELGDTTAELQVASGDVAHNILEMADQWQANLIVMGSHSRRFLEDIFMGNTTVKVVKRSTLPLLIIPTQGNEH